MLKKPPLYGDTVSFHHINAPFDCLFNNNKIISEELLTIVENLNIEYSPLTNKNIFTNGIENYFYIEKDEEHNIININNTTNNYLNPVFIKKYSQIENSTYTPLTFEEIVEYMENNNYARYQAILNSYIYKSDIVDSNLVSLNEGEDNGFVKNTDVVVDELIVKNTDINNTINQILNIDELSKIFIKKDLSYSLRVENDQVTKLTTNSLSFSNVEITNNYDKNLNSGLYLSKISDLSTELIENNQSVSLKIKTPLLNGPINYKTFKTKGNDFISLTDKQVDYISIEREGDIENDSVLTVSETENIVKNAILNINNLNIDNFDDFQKLNNSMCNLNNYLKIDMIIDSDKGYVDNFFNSTDTVINHQSFKKLLTYDKKGDNTPSVYISSNYFNKKLSLVDKEKFIKYATALGFTIDFKKDMFSHIFKTICDMISVLEYPTLDVLKSLQNVQMSSPLQFNQFIIIPPIMESDLKQNIDYYLTIPVFTAIKELFLINPPNVGYFYKNNYPYVLSIPQYQKSNKSLSMESPDLQVKRILVIDNILNIPTYQNNCNFDDMLMVPAMLYEAMAVRIAGIKNKIMQYSVFSSNRAVNNIEYVSLYKSVKNFLKKDFYICKECVISKDMASLIITSTLMKQIDKYPLDVDIFKAIDNVTATNINSGNSSQSVNIKLCNNNKSSSQLIQTLGKLPNGSFASLKITLKECRDSEIINPDSINIVDDFVLSEVDITNNSLNIKNQVKTYYSDKLAPKYLSSDFDSSKDETLSDFNKLFFTEKEVVFNGIDLGYAYDLFKKQNIGKRFNNKCDSTLLAKNAFWTFLPIYGNDSTEPTNGEQQVEALNSNTVGKHFVIPNMFNETIEMKISDCLIIDKKEKTYFITLYEDTVLTYYDIEENTIYTSYTSKDLDVSVTTYTDDEGEEKTILQIGSLSIYMDSKIEAPTLINMTGELNGGFDFSFIYKLRFSKSANELNSLFNDDPAFNAAMDNADVPVDSFQYVLPDLQIVTGHSLPIDDAVILDVKLDNDASGDVGLNNSSNSKFSSGAPLNRIGSIASPVCSAVADPDKDIIPGNIDLSISISGYIVSYTQDKKKKIYKINPKIRYQYGVIDGYFNDKNGLGELLANVNSNEEADELLKKYDFNKHKYTGDLIKDFTADIERTGDPETDKIKYLQNPFKIKFDLKAIRNSLVMLNGGKIPLYDENGNETDVSNLTIYILNKNINKEGIYFNDINVQINGVKTKAITKNKFMPIAIIRPEDNIRLTKSNSDTNESTYRLDTINKQAVIRIVPNLLYNTGIKLTFNEE